MPHFISIRFLAPVALLLMLSGCARHLSQQVHQRVAALGTQRTQVQNELGTSQRALQATEQGPNSAFLAPYARRESWAQSLQQAQQALDQTQPLSQQVKQIAAQDDGAQESSALGLIRNIESLMSQARQKAVYPQRRIDVLIGLKTNAPPLVEKAGRDDQATQVLVSQAVSTLRVAARKYPGKERDLRSQVAAFVQLRSDSAAGLKGAKAQLENLTRGRFVDDAALFAGAQKVAALHEQATTRHKESQEKIAQLSQSYTQTLVDMKVDYYVQISRESWDESSESESTTEYIYPARPVDKPTYEHFAGFAEDQVLATQGMGWLNNSRFSLNNGVDADAWERLAINQSENLSEGTAQWAMDGVDEKYFHKYIWIRNGVVQATDWQEVTPAFFDTHDDDLGMDISSKAPGEYASEVTHFASPPGMSYVGDPRYGRWRSDATNDRVWEFAGQALLFRSLLGSTRSYSFAEWSDWKTRGRGRAAYYGPKQKEEDEERYGTHSRSVGGNSYFARSYWVSSGEHRSQTASVRGAGSAARGGGPGGGGK